MSASVHVLKANFNGGEMSPFLDARVDTGQHATGCRILENMIPMPYGGVRKRPGTQYLGGTKADAKARLIPFRSSTLSNYILEFGPEYLRMWRDTGAAFEVEGSYTAFPSSWNGAASYVEGDLVVSSVAGGATYICTAAHSANLSVNRPGDGSAWQDYWTKYYFELGSFTVISTVYYVCIARYSPSSATFASSASNWHALTNLTMEIPTPYLEAELFEVQFCQVNDVLFLSHRNHFPKRLSCVGGVDAQFPTWKLENVPFEYAPVLDINETSTAVQVQFQIADWEDKSTAYAIGDRVVAIAAGYEGQVYTCHTPHTPTSVANDQPGSGSAWQTYWNLGTSAVLIPVWATSTAYAVGQKVRVGTGGSSGSNVIYECKQAHTSTPLRQPGNVARGNTWAAYWFISSADSDLSGIQFKLAATIDTFVAEDVGAIWQLSIGTTGNSVNQALGSGAQTISPTKPIFIQGPFLVRTNWLSGQAPTGGSLILEESLDNITWTRLREWVLDDAEAGNISQSFEAPAVGGWYRVSGSYAANTGADKVFIEPESSVLVLPFRITAYTSAQEVLGDLVMPNSQLPPEVVVGVSTTVYRKPAFSAEQGYPRAVAFHDSRIWWGGTKGNPARIWASMLDDFYIFLTGANDDSAIDITLASTEANQIQWMASQNRQIIVGTTGEEWTVDSGEADEVLTPSKIRARRRTRFGSQTLAPALIADALLWVQRGGRKLREFAYRFESDSYTAPEMTLLSEHLFRSSTIVQMAHQANPEPILWCVDSAGTLHGFSYDREQQITAWHRHRTGERESGGSTIYDSFESVATIYGSDGADQVWFVVNRGGKRRIERFQTTTHSAAILATLESSGVNANVCYVDSAKAGVAGTSQTGFSHLNLRRVEAAGATSGGVVAIVHGIPSLGNLTLSGSLPAGHWIGLPYTSKLRPMKLEIPLRNGTAQARRWRLTRVFPNLVASCGGKISPSLNITPTDIDYQGEAQPYTGQLAYGQETAGNWGNQLDLYITHAHPTPFNLVSAVLNVEVTTE